MSAILKVALLGVAATFAMPAVAQITFYERDNFEGRSFSTQAAVPNFADRGFNDRASSVEVHGTRWQVCEGANYTGRCIALVPGKYPSLASLGLDNSVSSVRTVPFGAGAGYQWAPPPGAIPASAPARITFFGREDFEGQSFATEREVRDLERFGFNDRASSVEVLGARWEACEGADYSGRCVALVPGKYPSLAAMGLDNSISSVRVVPAGQGREYDRPGPPAPPRITFFGREGFEGQSFTTEREVRDLERFGFNDRASSVEVVGTRWEVCDEPRFEGRCAVLRPGRYPTLRAMGLGNSISSVRILERSVWIDDGRYAPPPVAVHDGRDYRRRQNERLYEADVVSVRAVIGTSGQRCWIEREQVQSRANVPGLVAGAVIGGILGHQIGSGSGRDVATVGGAVAGGAIGANVGRSGSRDVERCASVPNQNPDYWDVVYTFRGQEHRVQMSVPPGRTVTVNERGEPRA